MHRSSVLFLRSIEIAERVAVDVRFTGDRGLRNATVHLAREGSALVILVTVEEHAFPAWKSERGSTAKTRRRDVSRMKIYERRFGDRVGVAREIHLASDRLWPLLRVTNRILRVARERCLPPCAPRRRSSGLFYTGVIRGCLKDRGGNGEI